MNVVNLSGALEQSSERVLQKAKMSFTESAAKLSALNPLSVLTRGYSVVTDKDGRTVSKLSDANVGDNVKIRLTDGIASASITSVEGK